MTGIVYRSSCFICGEEFSDFEWERHHTDEASGEAVHEDCCLECAEPDGEPDRTEPPGAIDREQTRWEANRP